MANECYIKNSKKYNGSQILNLVQKELKSKFNLDSKTEIVTEHNYYAVIVKELSFSFYLEKNRLSFYDTATSSFHKNHTPDHPYMTKGPSMRMELTFFPVYIYLHEYIKNFLADHMNTDLDSDGAGPYPAFAQPNKYGSYEQWFNYWLDDYKKRGLLNKIFMPSPKKIKKEELSYFPELAF